MELHIENIGAIGSVDVKIEGITVIGGENSTGKSTIGKVLYALLHDMSRWQEKFETICHSNIVDILSGRSIALEDICMQRSGAKRRRTSRVKVLLDETASYEKFIAAIEDFQIYRHSKGQEEQTSLVEHQLKNYLEDYCEKYIKLYTGDENLIQDIMKSFGARWCDETVDLLENAQIDELKIQGITISRSFSEIFKNQFQRIGEENSEIQWTDDSNRQVKISFSKEGTSLSAPVRLSENVYYLESPKIFDLLSAPAYGSVQKERLRSLMSPNAFIKREPLQYPASPLDIPPKQILSTDTILKELQSEMGGNAEFYQKVGLQFKDKKLKEPIRSVNISAGLKSLALLEYALRIGSVLPGDILILDEPEINLHPKWQAVYAKAMVQLQKEFHLKLIIASHSPYFIRAIEVYSDLMDTMDFLNVYLMERDENNIVTAENISYSEYGITELYERLSASLEELENMLEDAYDTQEDI